MKKAPIRIALVIALWTAAIGLPSTAGASDGVTVENCRGVFAFPLADPDAVRREARIPENWSFQPDPAAGDLATLAVITMSCERATINGQTQPLVYTTLSVFIDPPESVSGRSTSSFGGIGGETDFYLIAWATTSHEFAKWLEETTGLNQQVDYVPDLTFLYDSVTAGFQFEAPRATPFPFRLTATAPEPSTFVFPLVSNFWAETSRGAVMIETSHPMGDRVGPNNWTLQMEPNSLLGRMIGSAEASDVSEIGTEFSFSGQYRKDLP